MSDFGGWVSINDKRYVIDLPSYKVQDITDFSPRGTVGGQSIIQSELGLYQVLLQSDWRHGFGFQWYGDAMGYLQTDGLIDTRHPDIAMLMSQSTASDDTGGEKHGMVLYKNMPYFWGPNGMRRWSSAYGWEDVNIAGGVGGGSAVTAKGASVSSLTFPVVIDRGSNRMLVVSVATSGNVVVSGVTYNAVAMTIVGSQRGTGPTVSQWRLLAPTPGTFSAVSGEFASANVVVTLASATNVIASAQTLTNVNQTTPLGTQVTASGTATSAQATVVGTTGGMIVDVLSVADDIALTADVSQRELVDNKQTNVSMGVSAEVSTASVAMDWTWTGSLAYVIAAVEVNPVSVNAGPVNAMLPTGNYLFTLLNDRRLQRMTVASVPPTGVDWDETGVNARSTDYKWAIIHNGNVYAGKDTTNIVYIDSNSDLSQLAGDPADDSNEITVGQGTYPTIGAASFMGRLFVFRQDGMWEIGEDNIARMVLDYRSISSPFNFRTWGIVNSQIVYPIRDKLYAWNGVRVIEITPAPLTDTFPYTTYGRFDNFVEVGQRLYMTAVTNETTYEEHILCWDGIGWHKIAEPITSGAGIVTMLGYDSVNDRLWFHLSDTEQTTSFIPFPTLSDYSDTGFPTTGTHSLLTSRLDMGFRRVRKSTPSIIVGATNCNATRYLRLYYRLDDASTWAAWGGNDSVSNIVDSDGVTELTNPLSASYTNSIEYNHMVLRTDFVTDTDANSPILEDLTVRFLMRPDVAYGYSFAIVAASEAQFGTSAPDTRSVAEILADLKTARDSKSPINFIDPFGVTHKAYISSYNEQAVEWHGERRGLADIEHRVLVNLVSVD